MSETCADCAFFKRGYRLQSLKIPDWCDKHFHSQRHDDPACDQFRSTPVANNHPLSCGCPDCNPSSEATK